MSLCRSIICEILWFLLLFVSRSVAFTKPLSTGTHRGGTPCTCLRRSVSEAVADTVTAKVFPESEPPYFALVTERCSCDSDANTEAALESLHKAVSTGLIDLVSVRVNVPEDTAENAKREQRLVKIVQQLLQWSSRNSFCVVVSSDWMEAGIAAGAHGIHFKETHRHMIAQARKLRHNLLIVGTSTHTVESAMDAWENHDADYLFAGTCFETESHPEKTGDDLEGPAFPAQVVAAFDKVNSKRRRRRPRVLAIGGINASNCHAQTHKGSYVDGSCADGITTIRAVLQANDPAEEVRRIQSNMRG